MAFTNDGRITPADSRLTFEPGPVPGSPAAAAANCMFTPYDIPNARVEGIDVVVNKPKTLSYRAPGAPSGAFAVEQMIDEFCGQLGMDPIEFRLKNTAPDGARRVNGVANANMGF